MPIPTLAAVEAPRPFTRADHVRAVEELQAITATLEGAIEHLEPMQPGMTEELVRARMKAVSLAIRHRQAT